MRIASSAVQLNSRATYGAELATSTRVAETPDAPDPSQGAARTERREDGDRFERQADSPERQARRIGRLLDKLDRLAGKLANGEDVQGKIEKVLDKLDRLMQRSAAPAQITYDRTTSYREQQSVQFAATGSVTTADGQSYDFQAGFDLARLYARTETISLRLAGAPPVAATAAAAKPASTTPAAATPEATTSAAPVRVSALALGNAVLGYDRNQDNIIDPATELVGGSGGDGFKDLAALDSDGNGWIDEGDAAFSSLRLVTQNAGTLASQSLAGAGVGAVFTGSVATPFTYTSADNAPQGYLQRAGIYLSETGAAGVVRQVDVLV